MNARHRSIVFVSVIVIASVFAFAPAFAGVIAITEADNGREFTLARGDTLEVSLPATSGTGYTWQAAPVVDALVQPVGDTKFKIDASMPGAPGHQIFRFSVEASGTGAIEMHYVRPWEKDTPPAKVFKIMLIVR
jgi:inhibitor of cysteine peptidase